MPINLIDKIKPKGDFPLVDSTDIVHGSVPLPKLLPIVLTKAEYEAMQEAGTVDEQQIYFIEQQEDDYT